MREALFSELSIELPEDLRPGYRLEALELYNWGTFDGRVETLTMSGRNALVTGDIGSGKSTVVDAVTTLLLPANRINYNKAAGADTRERSLRTYVLGHYRSERVESTGASRPVGLRDHHHYSVILGRFRNDGHDRNVTLAQVFWMPGPGEQQPRRFFVAHDKGLSISSDFTDFGTDPADLKRRLRQAGAKVFDHFPEYGTRLRRLLGIRSEQALELFHQTISMKSVGNLTDFVRQHMLEPADASERIAALVAHFDDLSRAHDAVRKARDQLAQLEPIIAACDEHDSLGESVARNTAAREALRLWGAEHRLALLGAEHDRLTEQREDCAREEHGAAALVSRLEERAAGLNQARDGHAGGRLPVIEAQLREEASRRAERHHRAERHGELTAKAGLPEASDQESFERIRAEVDARRADAAQRRQTETTAITEATIEVRAAEQASDEIKAEIRSLRGRQSNIDSRSLALRGQLAQSLGVEEVDLPFVGELIQVREDHAQWRGAAERVLRGFALSVLVPTERYAQAAAWVDGHHLKGRFVYYRVGDRVARRSVPLSEHPVLADVLEVKPGRYEDWIADEVERRADHVRLDGPQDFARHRRAVTLRGQIKADRRHEKDDRFAVDDPTRWVLGWSNADKVDALVAAAADLTIRLNTARETLTSAQRAADEARARDDVLVSLSAFTDWDHLDWAASVRAIADLEAERAHLVGSSAELAALQEQIEQVGKDLLRAKGEQQRIVKRLGGLERDLERVAGERDDSARWVARIPEADALRHRAAFPAIEGRQAAPTTVAECASAEREIGDELSRAVTADQERQALVGQRAVRGIMAFRAAWPSDTVELGADLQSASEYREMQARIAGDDLPRFEAEFKKQLNTNTINDIAGFQAWLDQSAQTIRSRIRTIDDSLGAIDYNPGTRISLLTEPTTNQEVRLFREELRATTDDALSSGDQYSEERFRKVQAIVERFRGREGFTDADRRWTALVTDVRNWFVFAASERDRESGIEREHYTDSDGKSGGQKEKLAYTILAASLAYQFGLEWGAPVSKDFRFTVIDEAFGRGSDASTRYALELFRKLGLQLLVVTPLQKVHIIDPFVSAVGFVENRSGQRSRLQTLTIEDYHAERDRRAAVVEATA